MTLTWWYREKVFKPFSTELWVTIILVSTFTGIVYKHVGPSPLKAESKETDEKSPKGLESCGQHQLRLQCLGPKFCSLAYWTLHTPSCSTCSQAASAATVRVTLWLSVC